MEIVLTADEPVALMDGALETSAPLPTHLIHLKKIGIMDSFSDHFFHSIPLWNFI